MATGLQGRERWAHAMPRGPLPCFCLLFFFTQGFLLQSSEERGSPTWWPRYLSCLQGAPQQEGRSEVEAGLEPRHCSSISAVAGPNGCPHLPFVLSQVCPMPDVEAVCLFLPGCSRFLRGRCERQAGRQAGREAILANIYRVLVDCEGRLELRRASVEGPLLVSFCRNIVALTLSSKYLLFPVPSARLWETSVHLVSTLTYCKTRVCV